MKTARTKVGSGKIATFSGDSSPNLVHFLFSRCHAAGMELDSRWRTRTVGEAEARGYSHLRVTCSHCGRISDVPWKLVVRPPRINGRQLPRELTSEAPTLRQHRTHHR